MLQPHHCHYNFKKKNKTFFSINFEFDFVNSSGYLKLIQSNEHSEYSYISLADFFFSFFPGKIFKYCSRSILFFRGSTCDFF